MTPGYKEGEVTQLLIQWRGGDRGALDRLMPLVYDQLRQIAGQSVAEALLASILSARGPGRLAEAGQLAGSARQRLGKSEVFPDRMEVEQAEAMVAAASGHGAEALEKFRRWAAEAKAKRLVEMEWDAELRIARLEFAQGSREPAKQRALRVALAAEAAGYLRVAGDAKKL